MSMNNSLKKDPLKYFSGIGNITLGEASWAMGSCRLESLGLGSGLGSSFSILAEARTVATALGVGHLSPTVAVAALVGSRSVLYPTLAGCKDRPTGLTGGSSPTLDTGSPESECPGGQHTRAQDCLAHGTALPCGDQGAGTRTPCTPIQCPQDRP